MNEPRKQHYVPQLYLKNFSFGSKKNPQLNILSISPNKLYVANVKDTAVKRDLYTLYNREDRYA